MKKQICLSGGPSNEAGPFIKEAAAIATSAAAAQRTIHISQSFSGSGSTSATIVCFVTCPDNLVSEIRQAIDNTVRELLAEHGSRPVSVQ